jgi:hypothetical protein
MSQQAINCPSCGTKIEITEVLSHEIEEKLREQYAGDLKKKESTFLKELEAREQEFREKLLSERRKIEEKIQKQAAESYSLEITDLKNQLDERSKKLEVARKQEAELLIKKRELEDAKSSLELEMARRLDQERGKIKEEVSSKLDEEHRLKDAEKDKQLADMRRQIDDLKRKAEQGSQQMQGEVLELEVESLLKREFPFDVIEPVGKGVRGGDVLQRVQSQSGGRCGTILWEIKRTKTWSDGWVQKLKDDQREAKADEAVIVSEALPKGFNRFRQIENIWVTDYSSMVMVAGILRFMLMNVSKAREALVGKSEKMELVYNYLTGPEFRNRLEPIVECVKAMRDDLTGEKAASEKRWAKREKQIERVIANMLGMQGDLEGISGASLPTLEIAELESAESE